MPMVDIPSRFKRPPLHFIFKSLQGVEIEAGSSTVIEGLDFDLV